MNWRSLIRRSTLWLRDFRDLLNPRYCAICGHTLNSSEQKLCASCLWKLPYLPADEGRGATECLFWGRIPLVQARCLMRYRHDAPSHQLLVKLKYHHRPDIGVWMGRMMGRELLPQHFFDGIDCIIAVPLHWRRHWRRGYNQSIELGLGLARETGLPLVRRKLIRLRNNASQTCQSSPAMRMENVRNLFRARSIAPYRHVLLIDDVLTTGATLTACAEAIMQTNPDVRFSILTLAKA